VGVGRWVLLGYFMLLFLVDIVGGYLKKIKTEDIFAKNISYRDV
jgi:hypothetical protein